MQVSIETTTGLERRMTIVVSSETFEGQVTEKLQQAAGQVRLPGYRPGKVPMKELRRRYGKAVRQEVAGQLMQHSFVDAVQQEDVTPAGQPRLDVLSMEPGVDLEFTATFEVFPHVEIASLSAVRVLRPTAEISEDDVDRTIEHLREQRKDWVPVDRESQEGDQVKIDFVGQIDGDSFEGGTGEDVSLVLGQAQVIEDFDRAIEGAKAGERLSFDAHFPDDYQAEALRDKTATFDVTVHAVAEPQLPALDDEFVRSFGIEEGGVEAFRTEVRAKMQDEMETAIKNQVKRQVLDELARRHELQLPAALVDREIDSLRQQMQQQMQQYGAGQTAELPEELFRDEAEKRVKIGLLLNEIISRAGLEAPPEQVRARIEALAKNYSQPQQVVDWYYSDERQLNQIEMAVIEDLAVEHVLAQAEVTEKPSSYGDIVADRAIPKPEPGRSPDNSSDDAADDVADDAADKRAEGR